MYARTNLTVVNERPIRHARRLLDHCLDVSSGDNLLVSAPPVADRLVEALHRAAGERTLHLVPLYASPAYARAYAEGVSESADAGGEHVRALYEEADALVRVCAARNLAESPSTSAGSRGTDLPRVTTVHPARGDAQRAGLPIRQYERLVYDAVFVDGTRLVERNAAVAARLTDGSTLHIETPAGTDLRVGIERHDPLTDDGEVNLPGGEAYTTPDAGTATGRLVVDETWVDGELICGLDLLVEDGQIREYSADRNETALAGLFDAEGASHLSEVGVGTNPAVDTRTGNVLLDEKRTGTVHVAVGRAYHDDLPVDDPRPEATVHHDFVVDHPDTAIRVDGEEIVTDGQLCVA